MEYQTIKEKGKVKFVVLPIELFENILDRLEDESDLRAIREAIPARPPLIIANKHPLIFIVGRIAS